MIYVDYYFRTNTFPNDSERATLAETIRAIPGCEHYTPRHVYAYFGNLRAKAKSGSASSLYPVHACVC